MKAAICLSGAVSKINDQRFLTQNSLYSPGEYVNLNVCFNSIIKHIIEPNKNYSFEFFIHGWNQDLELSLNEIYKPQSSLFENNSNYNQEISSKIQDPNDFANVSKALSLSKSIELLQNSNLSFDKIILYRPDLILFKDINLNNYSNNIYVNQFQNGNGDFHFITNDSNIHLFKDIYHSTSYNPCKTHFWIQNYFNLKNINLIEDDIVAGIDQEVIRKVYTKTNQNINIRTLLKYGMTEEEAQKYE